MAQVQQIMDNKKLTVQQRGQQMTALQAAMEKEGQAVLTPAQVAAEKAMMKQAAMQAPPHK